MKKETYPQDTPYGPTLLKHQVVEGAPVWIIQAAGRVSPTLYMIEMTYADCHIAKLVRQAAHLHWPDRPDGTAWLCWSAAMHNDHFLIWDYEPLFDYTVQSHTDSLDLKFTTKTLREHLSYVISKLHPGWLEQYQKGFVHHE